MSVFSVIKRGRQQAKERARKEADQKKEKEVQPQPYKHVPTHAAQDALSCAPPTWRHDDRPRIMEQSRKRAAMMSPVPAPLPPGHPGARRYSSGLSNVMYPAAHANPLVSISRSNGRKEGTIYLQWPYRSPDPAPYVTGETPYVPRLPSISSSQEAELEQSMAANGTSASQGTLSTTDSEGNSSPSPLLGEQDGVTGPRSSGEYQYPARSNSYRSGQVSPTNDVSGVHRLHPSRHRRWSDGSERKPAYSSQHKHPQALTSSRDSRPPPSMRGFGSIPPPSYPPIEIPRNLYHSSSSLSSSTASTASLSSRSTVSSSSQSQAGSSTASTTPTSTTSSPLKTTPIIPSASEFVFPFMADSNSHTTLSQSLGNPDINLTLAEAAARRPPQDAAAHGLGVHAPAPAQLAAATSAPARDGRKSKTTRFSELETIIPDNRSWFGKTSPPPRGSLERKYSAPPQLSNDVITRALSRQSQTQSPSPTPDDPLVQLDEPKSKGKLVKRGPSKLSKKRWSTGNSPPVGT